MTWVEAMEEELRVYRERFDGEKGIDAYDFANMENPINRPHMERMHKETVAMNCQRETFAAMTDAQQAWMEDAGRTPFGFTMAITESPLAVLQRYMRERLEEREAKEDES